MTTDFYKILTCGAVVAAAAIPSYARTRIAPSRERALGLQTEMIVAFDDPETLDSLRTIGPVQVYPGNVAVISMSADRISEAAGLSGVNSIRPQRKMRPLNDRSKKLSDVADVWNGDALPRAYDGTGIVIGVYDIGLDPNSPNFNDAEGNSRIKAVYRYPEGEAEPICYTTPEEIRCFTTDDTEQTHGSHVLGTLAGSYRHESAKTDYRGMAPGAEMIVTTGQGYEAQMLDAIRRVGDYAESVGKPCVMNFSWGDNIGPHDGSDPFVAAMNAMADEYDMLIVCAAGNEAADRIAIVKELTEEDCEVKTFLQRGGDTQANQGEGMLQVWADDDTPFTVTLEMIVAGTPDNEPLVALEMPQGRETYLTAGPKINEYLDTNDENIDFLDETKFGNIYSNSFIGGIVGVSELNGHYCADLYSYLNSTDPNRFVTRLRVKGTPGQRIHVYTANSDDQVLSDLYKDGHDGPDGNGSNSNMACGPNTLSVGSYVSDTSSGGTLLAPSYFSSYGPTTDGRFVPDVCAPGQVITSTFNSYYNGWYHRASVSYIDPVTGKEVLYCPNSGTSMASPHVCGIAALVRQADPGLSYADVKRLIIDNAKAPRKDPENPAWGHGQANAYNAVKAAVENSGVSGNIADSRDILAMPGDDGNWTITVPSADTFRVVVYDIQGRRMAQYISSGSCITLNPLENVSTNGVYVMRVMDGRRNASFKIMK